MRKLSSNVHECKPLACGINYVRFILAFPLESLRRNLVNSQTLAQAEAEGVLLPFDRAVGRGLHSSNIRLNVSAFCGIGGACRCCLLGVWQVSGGIRGCLGCDLRQKRLRLS
jgi:hypothetical protein